MAFDTPVQDSVSEAVCEKRGNSMYLGNIEDITYEIRQKLSVSDIESAIIFGSYAHGEATQESDVDLYVVTKDDFIPATWRESKNIYAKISRQLLELQKTIPIDLLVHTKKMRDVFMHNNADFAHQVYTKGIHIV